MIEGPLSIYRARRRQGLLRPDMTQELAAEKLQSLHNAVRLYEPAAGRGGWKQRLGLARRKVEPPQGLYMFGGVGRGKSLLMDLFFEGAPVEAKRRVHFHAFMAEVHDRLHAWRKKTRGTKADPLPELAAEMAEDAWLLCFDEFHVVNIADAMILARFFEALFDCGAVMVATSNFPPDRLYEGGLQRENFLPFIDLLKQRLDILELGGRTDYRQARLLGMRVYHTPLGDATRQALEKAFADLTEGAEVTAESLCVKGRDIAVPEASRGVARFSFEALCGQPLGAEDYLALAGRYHTVILSDVPLMGAELRNEARRFMTLIDVLYEHRVKLILSAAAEPEALYTDGPAAFEFQRTASRLNEMRSKDYVEAAPAACV